jgi:outer membrane protein assembly factor BamB
MRTFPVIVVFGLSLAGCSTLSDLNPFAIEEEKLPGERIAVIEAEGDLRVDKDAARVAVAVPASRKSSNWAQPGGVASNAPGNLRFSGQLGLLWKANAGEGSSSEGRLTSRPIVYNGRIYTIDAEATLHSFSTGGGKSWRMELTPENEEEESGYGGGIAAADDKVFAVTGFGRVVAVNSASGKLIWSRMIGSPVRSSPTTANGKLFFTTAEGVLYCLSAESGDELWQYRGIPEPVTILGNVSPAVVNNVVVVPYPSGDVIAMDINTGKPLWGDTLARARRHTSLTSLSDPASPAIDHNMVFAVGHAGRMVAVNLKTGERLWSQSIRGTQIPLPAGNMVYVVDVSGRLIAMLRETGKIRWVVQLPGTHRWSGPVMANGKLWLVSYKGLVVGVSPDSGKITGKRDLGEKIFISPVIAGGRMYILDDDATLYAMN